jgi:hypothetical protein
MTVVVRASSARAQAMPDSYLAFRDEGGAAVVASVVGYMSGDSDLYLIFHELRLLPASPFLGGGGLFLLHVAADNDCWQVALVPRPTSG